MQGEDAIEIKNPPAPTPGKSGPQPRQSGNTSTLEQRHDEGHRRGCAVNTGKE